MHAKTTVSKGIKCWMVMSGEQTRVKSAPLHPTMWYGSGKEVVPRGKIWVLLPGGITGPGQAKTTNVLILWKKKLSKLPQKGSRQVQLGTQVTESDSPVSDSSFSISW